MPMSASFPPKAEPAPAVGVALAMALTPSATVSRAVGRPRDFAVDQGA